MTKPWENANGDASDQGGIAVSLNRVEAPGIEAGRRRHFNVKRAQSGDEDGESEPPISPGFPRVDADPDARQRLKPVVAAAGALAVMRVIEDDFDRLWAEELGIVIGDPS